MLVLFNFLYLMAMRNTELATQVAPEQLELAESQITAYWAAPWHLILLGALERLLTQPIQIGFSVLVFQAVTRKKAIWLLIAVLWHAIVDAVAVVSGQTQGIIVTEILIGVASMISIAAIFALRIPEPVPGQDSFDDSVYPQNFNRVLHQDAIETPERLEQTKFR